MGSSSSKTGAAAPTTRSPTTSDNDDSGNENDSNKHEEASINNKKNKDSSSSVAASASTTTSIISRGGDSILSMTKFVYGTINCWFQVPFNSMACCFSIFCIAFRHGNLAVRTSLAAYFIYGIFDTTPISGKRYLWSYTTINNIFRHYWGFYHVAQFFPVTLQKTCNLNPKNQAYIFLYHPHGVISMGCSCALTTNACNFDDHFPGIVRWGICLNASFWCPFFREWLLWNGFLCANKSTLVSKLIAKESIVLIPGGAAEALHAHHSNFRLYLQNRKGFIRLALETSAALVPCLGFGENAIFSTFYAEESSSSPCSSSSSNNNIISHSPSWLLQLQHSIYKMLTFSTPILLHPFPLQRKIQVIVGTPVQFDEYYSQNKQDITNDLVDKCHQQYLQALQTLYDEHKEECGYKDTSIEFL